MVLIGNVRPAHERGEEWLPRTDAPSLVRSSLEVTGLARSGCGGNAREVAEAVGAALHHRWQANVQGECSPLYGVVGGLGPLASNAFLRSIYSLANHACEQRLPRVLLSSDPSTPDRTSSLLNGSAQTIVDSVRRSIEQLTHCGASRIVLCCFTAHHILARLPAELAANVVALPSVALELVDALSMPVLCLATTGARELGVFQSEGKQDLAQLMRWPAPRDQEQVHALIYSLKKNENLSGAREFIQRLCERYGTHYWLGGCTELHLLADVNGAEPVQAAHLDPLYSLAFAIARSSWEGQ